MKLTNETNEFVVKPIYERPMYIYLSRQRQSCFCLVNTKKQYIRMYIFTIEIVCIPIPYYSVTLTH